MPKNFDTDGSTKRGARLAQDGEFVLGGETFKLRRGLAVGNTALDQWRDVLRRMTAAEDEREDGFVDVEDAEFLDAFRSTMLALLEPGQAATFERVLANEEAPVMIPDAFEVCFWAVGVVTGRPTAASPPSSNGSATPTEEPDESSSTDGSSSPAAAASTA